MSRPASRAARSPLGEILDRLMLLEPPLSAVDGAGATAARSARRGPAVAPITLRALYRSARRRQGRPLAETAAGLLLARLRPGEQVVVTTGLVTGRIPRGETDGPTGAAVLSRALIRRCGISVTLLTEAEVREPLEETLEALATAEGEADGWRQRLAVRAFPCGLSGAEAEARRIWERLRPRAVIGIEKLGPNARGVIHNLRGEDVTASQARVDRLFTLANRMRGLTVGIGDRGNEVGLGGLAARPRPCICPCGGCLECAVAARAPVVAFSSNWGAYALTAALAAAGGTDGLTHRPATEARMLSRLARAGAVDGVTGRREPTVDGVRLPVQAALVGMLAAVVAGRRP